MSIGGNETHTTKTGRMLCKVVSKADPEELGRIQLRFYDQSEVEIPNNKLPWTIPEGKCHAGPSSFELGRYFVGQWLEGERDTDLGNTTRIVRIVSSPSADEKDVVPKTAKGEIGSTGKRLKGLQTTKTESDMTGTG